MSQVENAVEEKNGNEPETNSEDAEISRSVDPDEVEKFSALAAEWWDPKGNFKPLHALNPVRVTFIRNLVVDHYGLGQKRGFNPLAALSGQKVLDIGCGGGLLTEPMTRLGADVTGIDVSEKNIKTASVHAREQGLATRYLFTSAEELAKAEPETYDVITSMEVIEHVADVESFIGAASKMLKPGGILLLATLNKTVKSYGLAIIGAEYILGWLPRGTHDWNRFLSPKDLAALCRRHGLMPGDAVGVSLNILSGDWRVSRDLQVNYMLSAVKG
jgi:2-polyprenyl-6-hydroxyphenyl methylase / 3-demethylubiquinone-9 3-methyltransferase